MMEAARQASTGNSYRFYFETVYAKFFIPGMSQEKDNLVRGGRKKKPAINLGTPCINKLGPLDILQRL